MTVILTKLHPITWMRLLQSIVDVSGIFLPNKWTGALANELGSRQTLDTWFTYSL